MNREVDLTAYIAWFVLIYAAALIAIGTLLTVLDLDAGTSGSIAALIAAVMVTTARFVDREKRVPTREERKKLMWLSLAASILVSLVLTVGVLAILGQLGTIAALPGVIAQVELGLVVGILVFVAVLYILALWFSYGWFAKMHYKAKERKGEI